MDKILAVKVLTTLAQGIDPATGELFPEDSPYNRMETVRSLFFAADCLRAEKQPPDSSDKRQIKTDASVKQATSISEKKQAEPIELTDVQKELYEKLRKWRSGQSLLEGIPPYMVLSNDSLARIACSLPETKEELAQVKGFGEIKLLKYADLILPMVHDSKY